MPFAAALSLCDTTSEAVAEVATQLAPAFAEPPDLALTLFSPHHLAEAASLSATLREKLRPRVLLGCVGEGIIGNDREIEEAPGLVVWLGKWRRPVELAPFHLTLERAAEGFTTVGWPDSLLPGAPAESALLLLDDPFTFPIDLFLDEINTDHRGLRVVGGRASGVPGANQCRLLLDDQVFEDGAIGVLMQGP